mgnify:FL=1
MGTVLLRVQSGRPTEGINVASLDDCRVVVHELAAKLGDVDPEARKKHIPDRTLQLTLLDLYVSFRGRLHDGELIDSEESEETSKPNGRLVMSSDDLIALTNGDLNFAHAWATGRIRLDASLRDLLRLRKLM